MQLNIYLCILAVFVVKTQGCYNRLLKSNVDNGIFKRAHLGQSDLELTCNVANSATSEGPIQWKKDGLILSSNDRMTVTPNKLVIKKVEEQDIDDTYTCYARIKLPEGIVLSDSQTFKISVESIVKIEKNAETIYEGEEMVLRCSITGRLSQLYFSWTKNGFPIRYKGNNERIRITYDNVLKFGTLTISNVNENDAGNYTCIVKSGIYPRKNHTIDIKIEKERNQVIKMHQ